MRNTFDGTVIKTIYALAKKQRTRFAYILSVLSALAIADHSINDDEARAVAPPMLVADARWRLQEEYYACAIAFAGTVIVPVPVLDVS